MLTACISVIIGLAVMLWSADRFIEGGASIADHLGVPPLLVGIVILGFGTSAPEMVVAALSAIKGNPGLALGNAYGSNIANISLVLGVTALICPMLAIDSSVIKKELPILIAITALAAWQLSDSTVTQVEAFVLLGLFVILMGWSIWQGFSKVPDNLGTETEQELIEHAMPLSKAILWTLVGLVFLVLSSHILVTGAVDIAKGFGVSDLLIGLTVVAIGTSLPELTASIVATRKGESDIAIGNILGSNMFNTLAVVGIAGSITPISVSPEVLSRDILVMAVLTVLLFAFCYVSRDRGSLSRFEGGVFLTLFIAYNLYLISSVFI